MICSFQRKLQVSSSMHQFTSNLARESLSTLWPPPPLTSPSPPSRQILKTGQLPLGPPLRFLLTAPPEFTLSWTHRREGPPRLPTGDVTAVTTQPASEAHLFETSLLPRYCRGYLGATNILASDSQNRDCPRVLIHPQLDLHKSPSSFHSSFLGGILHCVHAVSLIRTKKDD